ncbi:MAG: thiamine pyrophosphate-binding protein [Candidatus Omnitrophota bacterium]
MNIQRADINPKLLKSFNIPYQRKSSNVLNQKLIKRIREFLNASSRPIVLIGGGVRLAKAGDELFRLIKKTEVPVVSSLMGLDAFPHDHPSFVGMFGSYGNRYANLAVANSDLILALGIRLDTRQTGTNPKTFARFAKIIHVDIDRYELNNKVKVDIAINSDLKVFLKTLNSKLTSFDKQRITPWLKRISAYKKKYPSFQNYRGKVIEPNFFIHKLSEFIPQGAVVCVDVGQNQMWAAQSLKLAKSQRFLTQGGMGAMGSALSMAIGAACTQPRKTIVVITGDGGFQLNSQELQTVYHHKLPIKIILLNNRCYGMVRQFQEQYFKSRLQSTVIGYSEPDFQKVVSAYKIKTAKITKKNQITKALNKLFKTKTPEFLEIGIEPCSKVLPKLSVNRPLEEQDPLLSYKELKSNMIVELL